MGCPRCSSFFSLRGRCSSYLLRVELVGTLRLQLQPWREPSRLLHIRLCSTFIFFFTIAGEAVFQTTQAYMPEFSEEQERAKQRYMAAEAEEASMQSDGKGGGGTSGVGVGNLNRITSKELLEDANQRVQKLARKILKIAALIGTIQVLISFIPSYLIPAAFTNDEQVQASIRELSPMLGAAIFPHCVTIAIEALLLNSKDMEFLASAHILTLIAWAVFLRWQAQTKSSHWIGLSNLWKGMCYFQYSRCLIWGARALFSGKKLGIHTYTVYRPRRRRAEPASNQPNQPCV